jgi:protein-ribulosamine 3-kinase
VAGGCINECYRVTSEGEHRFLKLNDARYADAFAAEADGLEALRTAGMRVPAPLACGAAAGKAYLLLEFLDLTGKRDFARLGRMLAAVHKQTAARFGWHRDNFIGASPLGILEDYAAKPSLLHGDLWSGNAGFTAEGPVVFDPAVYYGDREADLAMAELFGGFPREFYRAYAESFPLEEGYERRKTLYKLYHLLNHLNLFGGGYLGQVKAALGLLLRP